jgi:heat shock protein HslJ
MSAPVWAATAALLLALTACGDSDEAPSAAPTSVGTEAAPTGLDGTKFFATSVTGRRLVAGTTLRLAFEDGHLIVHAGCNTQSAPYAVEGSTLRWTGPPASTMIGCPPALAEQDQWLAEFFTAGADATVNRAGAILTDGEVTIDLTLDVSED